MKYIEAIEHDYQQTIDQGEEHKVSRLAYAGSYLFGFTTYDDELDIKFGGAMLEVLEAIMNQTTHEYQQQSPQHYETYILMCNSSFLKDKLEWGTSIRGAWLDHDGALDYPIKVEKGDFKEYVSDIITWLRTHGTE